MCYLDWRGIEDTEEYDTLLENVNLSYDLWTFSDSSLKMLVTSQLDGIMRKKKNETVCYVIYMLCQFF